MTSSAVIVYRTWGIATTPYRPLYSLPRTVADPNESWVTSWFWLKLTVLPATHIGRHRRNVVREPSAAVTSSVVNAKRVTSWDCSTFSITPSLIVCGVLGSLNLGTETMYAWTAAPGEAAPETT